MSCATEYDDPLQQILCNEGNILRFFDRIFDFLYRRTDFFKVKHSESLNFGLEPGEAEKIIKCTFCKYMERSAFEQKRDQEDSVSLDFIAEEVVSNIEENIDSCSAVISSTGSSNDASRNVPRENTRTADKSAFKVPVMDPDSYNGARYEDYCWSQTRNDVDLRVVVPQEVTAGKQVQVVLQQDHLKTEILEGSEWHALKQGDLSFNINVQESTWTLVPGEHIHICLQKNQSKWWDSLFVGEPKIDLQSIDPSIPFEDLDQESRAKIEELMYNEHLKRLGKPTIKQQRVQDALKKAWNAESSPFKGQPFDPSILDVQNTEQL